MSGLDLLNVFSDYWLKPVLSLTVVLWLCHWSVAKSPQACHWMLLILFAVVLISIPLKGLMPALPLDINTVLSIASFDTILSHWQASTLRNLIYFGCVFYVLIALSLLLRHGRAFYAAKKIVIRSEKVAHDAISLNKLITRPVKVRESSDLCSPVVWGFFNPVVLLPKDWVGWSHRRLTRVLKHELAHIERRDWLSKNMLYIARALFWFIPPIWLLVRRVELYAEYACDDQVISSGEARSDYARDLLDLSTSAGLKAPFVSISGSELANRINLVLDGGRHRENASAVYKIYVVLLAFLLVLPLYAVTFISVPSAPNYSSASLNLDLSERRVAEYVDVEDVLLRLLPREEYVSTTQPPSRFYVESKLPGNPISSQISFAEISIADLNVGFNSDVDVKQAEIYKPKPRVRVYPDYPETALRYGLESRIKVKFDINESGQVENIRFIGIDRRDTEFSRAVAQSLSKTKFEPPIINGRSFVYKDAEEEFNFRNL